MCICNKDEANSILKDLGIPLLVSQEEHKDADADHCICGRSLRPIYLDATSNLPKEDDALGCLDLLYDIYEKKNRGETLKVVAMTRLLTPFLRKLEVHNNV